MARRLSPEERRELLGAYALDAVDRDERAQVEELLLDDQAARAEFHALQLARAWLELAERRPSERVWDRIAAEMHKDSHEGPSPITELPIRRRVPRGLVEVGAIAAAFAIASFAISGGFGSVSTQRSVADAASAAARNPAARTVALRSADGRTAGQLVVLPNGRGFLTRSSLPMLGRYETYQLWAITSKGPVSAAVLGHDPGVTAFRVKAGAISLAITPEPQGGSRTPTGAVVAQGRLRFGIIHDSRHPMPRSAANTVDE